MHLSMLYKTKRFSSHLSANEKKKEMRELILLAIEQQFKVTIWIKRSVISYRKPLSWIREKSFLRGNSVCDNFIESLEEQRTVALNIRDYRLELNNRKTKKFERYCARTFCASGCEVQRGTSMARD